MTFRDGRLARLAVVLLAFSIHSKSAVAEAAPGTAIDLGEQRELFVDRHLIDTMTGIELRLHHPIDEGMTFAFDKPWEGAYAGYTTVIHTDDGKYQAYYRGTGPNPKSQGDHQVTCYAESSDGIHWTKPTLELFPRDGERLTNIVLADATPDSHNFTPFIDTKPGVKPDEKYKGIGGHETSGLSAYASADGIRWKKIGEKPILTRQQVGMTEDQKDITKVFDSQNVAFWSDLEGKYVLYYRVWFKSKRRIARVESVDFANWTNPTLMKYERDGKSAPTEHLYTNQTHPYFRAPQLYIATAARFMPGRQVLTTQQAEAIGVHPKYFGDTSDAILMTSRGGDVYDRTFMSAFIAPGIGIQNWVSRTNYPAVNIVQTSPTEMSVYVSQDYAQQTNHLRRYSLRLDGFASARAEYKGGEMLTKPLTFKGSSLLLNFATSAYGGLRVEMQDAAGVPIPGFTLEDCQEVIGNEIERAVTWKGGDLTPLAGKPVRARFVMKDADLFALRFGDAAVPTP